MSNETILEITVPDELLADFEVYVNGQRSPDDDTPIETLTEDIIIELIRMRAKNCNASIYDDESLTDARRKSMQRQELRVQSAVKTLLDDELPVTFGALATRSRCNRDSLLPTLGRMGLYGVVMECEEKESNKAIIKATKYKKPKKSKSVKS